MHPPSGMIDRPMKKPIKKKQKANPPPAKKAKAPLIEPKPIRGVKNTVAAIEVKTIAKAATFGRTLARLRKERANGDVDEALQKEILTAMLNSTNKMISVCEKAVITNPAAIKSLAYPYNSLVSQSREIMHDLRLLQVTGQQSEKMVGLVQSAMGNIVQSLVDVNSIYKAQAQSKLSSEKDKAKVAKAFEEAMRLTAKALDEHYKGLVNNIQGYYSPKGAK
jgi:hypothetical protein